MHQTINIVVHGKIFSLCECIWVLIYAQIFLPVYKVVCNLQNWNVWQSRLDEHIDIEGISQVEKQKTEMQTTEMKYTYADMEKV